MQPDLPPDQRTWLTVDSSPQTITGRKAKPALLLANLPILKSSLIVQRFDVPGKARLVGTTSKFEDVYEKEKRVELLDKYNVGDVDWSRDIWQLLQWQSLLSWANGQANGGHDMDLKAPEISPT